MKSTIAFSEVPGTPSDAPLTVIQSGLAYLLAHLRELDHVGWRIGDCAQGSDAVLESGRAAQVYGEVTIGRLRKPNSEVVKWRALIRRSAAMRAKPRSWEASRLDAPGAPSLESGWSWFG